jgi:microcystin-dependent protein
MATENVSIQNFYVDSLKEDLAAGDTVIYLNEAPAVSEGYLVISPNDPSKREIIYYTSLNSQLGTVTCPSVIDGRGLGGTTAQAHSLGEMVKMNITAEYWMDLKEMILKVASPVGSIIPFGGSTAPSGWAICDGASYVKADYTALYAAIGTAWGTADSAHFNIPDLRGKFLRGVDHAAGFDPDRAARAAIKTGGATGDAVGSWQDAQYQQHNHGQTGGQSQDHTHGYTTVYEPGHSANGSWFNHYEPTGGTTGGASQDHSHATNNAGGNETRPKNANVEFIIRVL